MSAFRKKPVVIEAVLVRYSEFNPAIEDWEEAFEGRPFEEMPDWLSAAIVAGDVVPHTRGGTDDAQWDIKTLEGVMTARSGDWIIRGIKGELYPCRPDIFAGTYEDASSPQEAAPGAVGVRKLEWLDEDDGVGQPTADWLGGRYWVCEEAGRFELRLEYPLGGNMYQTLIGAFHELEQAKTAAQSDYDQRIRSALTVLPSGQNETGGGEPWQRGERELALRWLRKLLTKLSSNIQYADDCLWIDRLLVVLATPASGERNAVVERMAEGMWRHELDDMSPAASRVRHNADWTEQSDNTKDRWRLRAGSAFDALTETPNA